MPFRKIPDPFGTPAAALRLCRLRGTVDLQIYCEKQPLVPGKPHLVSVYSIPSTAEIAVEVSYSAFSRTKIFPSVMKDFPIELRMQMPPLADVAAAFECAHVLTSYWPGDSV